MGSFFWEIFAMGDLQYPDLGWNLEFVGKLVNGFKMKPPSHTASDV